MPSIEEIQSRLAAEGALANLRGFGHPISGGWMKLERRYLRQTLPQQMANDIFLSFKYAAHLGLIEVRRRNEYRIVGDRS